MHTAVRTEHCSSRRIERVRERERGAADAYAHHRTVVGFGFRGIVCENGVESGGEHSRELLGDGRTQRMLLRKALRDINWIIRRVDRKSFHCPARYIDVAKHEWRQHHRVCLLHFRSISISLVIVANPQSTNRIVEAPPSTTILILVILIHIAPFHIFDPTDATSKRRWTDRRWRVCARSGGGVEAALACIDSNGATVDAAPAPAWTSIARANCS